MAGFVVFLELSSLPVTHQDTGNAAIELSISKHPFKETNGKT
jgi:hypothetical protein